MWNQPGKLHQLDQPLRVHRLLQIVMHFQILVVEKPLIHHKRAEYRDHDVHRGTVLPQSLEKFDSSHSRHFKIEQNQLWQGLIAVGEPALAKNEVERFISIGQAQYFLRHARSAESAHRQFGIRNVVFNEEDVDPIPLVHGSFGDQAFAPRSCHNKKA